MQRVCKVCNTKYELDTFNRDVEPWLIDVCCVQCLIEWIKCLAKVESNINNKLQNPIIRPFQSLLEELLFKKLHLHFNILYEPYILKQNKSIYIPDFYIVDKNIFIEVKGGRHRISKFKKFAKHYPLYIVMLNHKLLEVRND